MFPIPAASHDHTLGVVLLCRRVWSNQFSWVPFSIIQCIAYVRNTYHPFLDQSRYTHAHTPGALSSPPIFTSSLSSCGWIKLCMYVCVRMYACAGFACTWPDWSGLMSLMSQQQGCIYVPTKPNCLHTHTFVHIRPGSFTGNSLSNRTQP
jgi:hypothetical protein